MRTPCSSPMRRGRSLYGVACAMALAGGATAAEAPRCNRTIVADVVALDQPFLWNRLGAAQPGGMIFALKGDVVACDPGEPGGALKPGRVMLRPGKRPRPIVLRMNVGDCLQIHFTNLLAPAAVNGSAPTRYVGLHVNGLDLACADDQPGIASDASWVGKNPGATGSLAAPGQTKVYKLYAPQEGTFLLSSAADDVDGLAVDNQATMGLFGAVNVQPEWAEWYRSQVTHDDLVQATMRAPQGPGGARQVQAPRMMSLERQLTPQRAPRMRQFEGRQAEVYTLRTVIPDKRAENTTEVMVVDGRLYTSPQGQPLIDYRASYRDGPRAGLPVLKMLRTIRGEPLFTVALNPAQMQRVVEGFTSTVSYVASPLADAFHAHDQPLSDLARITGEEGRAWLVTDPGRALYLVEVDEARGRVAVSAASLQLVASDLTAIITGPNADRFGYDLNSPSFINNPPLPDRRQPYREFTIIYHRAGAAVQAFPQFYNANTQFALSAGQDGFAINYGTGAIGPEIIANRLGVGPMGNADAVDLKYEEFFLSAWAVGDPSMIVDVPANAQDQAVASPAGGSRVAQQPLFTLDVDQDVLDLLGTGGIAPKLKDAFQQHGITLTDRATPSLIAPDQEWIILDPYDANAAPAADRKRYPIVAGGQKKVDGKTLTTITVYAGFPIAPNVPSFNGPAPGKATMAFYPDDPSNVYHSNMRDHVKFRILHAGPGPSHVHHLHAHQWLHSPNATNSQYLDSQLIIPGAAYTLEIVHNGSGNRNQTVGDSIFHCHFYPHFAQGMWALWRVHDVFEAGTLLDVDGRPVTLVDLDGRPVYKYAKGGEDQFYAYDEQKVPHPVPADEVRPAFNRALPDGEIAAGTPIPAIIPLPSLAMPLLPAKVRLTDLAPFYPEGQGQGRRVYVEPKNAAEIADARRKGEEVPDPEYDNPGYPFFIPGVSGHRAPHPPLDFAWREDPRTGDPVLGPDGKRILLDGGLPRHVVLDGQIVKQYQTRWDFTRDFIAYDPDDKPVAGKLSALHLPEDGTPVEQAAMRAHATRTHASRLPSGDHGNFILNGLPPRPGAPFADPTVDDDGNANFNTRRYQAAVIQTDVVQNKLGWHYPQQRFLTLWEDVAPTIGGRRPPQPLFFRSNTDDAIEFWHTNLVPSYYELDDFQVRTPTDVIGQHIHNVKFDVTSSDGAGNGFNYEDGTFSPQEVRDRVHAIDRPGGTGGFAPGLLAFDPQTGFLDKEAPPRYLKVVPIKDAYPRRGDAGDNRNGLFGPPPRGQDWDGAQTTVQLWDTDALLDDLGRERTLRTIFTHDHFGPSTHQQAGLYAGLVVEPQGSLWYLPDGSRMNRRRDGGPTNWEGYIVPTDTERSYREFVIEFQDLALAYANTSRSRPGNALFDPTKTASAPAAFDVAQYGDLARQQIGAFIAILDRGSLPPAFPATIFPGMGISLSPKATVKVVRPSLEWVIQEPAPADGGALNAGASYNLRASNFFVPVPNGPRVPQSILVYVPGIDPGWADPANALNPPVDGNNSRTGAPFPQIVSAAPAGTYAMNYRNESVLARVAPPPKDDAIVRKDATDLGYVFSSIARNNPALNDQPRPGSPIDPAQPDGFKFPPALMASGVEGTDPYTPLLRAYAHDQVQVRTLVGAHLQSHAFQIQGVRWDFEPGYPDSGLKNAQGMGISEHFEMLFRLPPAGADHAKPRPAFADYLYSPSSGIGGLANGLWGIMRAYNQRLGQSGEDTYLAPLPNNPLKDVAASRAALARTMEQVRANFDRLAKIPAGDPVPEDLKNYRIFNVTATTAFQALPEQALCYNPTNQVYQLNTAVLYVRSEDLEGGILKPGAPREPLILRAAAGDWIRVNLTNALTDAGKNPAFALQTSLNAGTPFQGKPGAAPTTLPPPNVPLKLSQRAGLHPALVWYDVTQANGVNVGFNPDATVDPGQTRSFDWYAGDVEVGTDDVALRPIEFGATNLVPADLMVQPQFGLVGALVVEPEGSRWQEDLGTRATATVYPAQGRPFRDFVLVGQNLVANTAGKWGAFNYRTETFASRRVNPAAPPPGQGFAKAFSNAQLTPPRDPVTPVFRAAAGTPVRFRLVMPSTSTSNVWVPPFVFDIHGHGWQEEPYVARGARIGRNPRSQYFGSQQVVPYEAYNIVLDRAGGRFEVAGDFLYETFQQTKAQGTWGLLRVEPDLVAITGADVGDGTLVLKGIHQPSPQNDQDKVTIKVTSSTDPSGGPATVDGQAWSYKAAYKAGAAVTFTVTSSLGGAATVQLPLTTSLCPPAK